MFFPTGSFSLSGLGFMKVLQVGFAAAAPGVDASDRGAVCPAHATGSVVSRRLAPRGTAQFSGLVQPLSHSQNVAPRWMFSWNQPCDDMLGARGVLTAKPCQLPGPVSRAIEAPPLPTLTCPSLVDGSLCWKFPLPSSGPSFLGG